MENVLKDLWANLLLVLVLPLVKSVVRRSVGVVVEQHDSEELTCFQVSGANQERPVNALWILTGDVFWSKHAFIQFKAILEIHLVSQTLEDASPSNEVHDIPHH